MAKRFWLVKTEPGAYSWQDLVTDGRTEWDGVRNYQARNNLREMAKGDEVLVYHSVGERRVMGAKKANLAIDAAAIAQFGVGERNGPRYNLREH